MTESKRSIGKNHYHTNHKTKKRPSRSWAQIHYASADPRANSYIRKKDGYGNRHYKSPFNEKLTFGGRVKRFFGLVFKFKKHVKAPSIKSQNPLTVHTPYAPKVLKAERELARIHQRKGKK